MKTKFDYVICDAYRDLGRGGAMLAQRRLDTYLTNPTSVRCRSDADAYGVSIQELTTLRVDMLAVLV